MSRLHHVAAVLFVATVLPVWLHGQGAVLKPGQRIRVQARVVPGGRADGVIRTISEDSILVTFDSAAPQALAKSDIERLELWRGFRWGRVKAGIAIGGLLGGLTGLAIFSSNDCSGELLSVKCSPGMGFLVGASFGGLVGGGVGALTAMDPWEPVNPRLIVAPTPKAVTVAVRLRF